MGIPPENSHCLFQQTPCLENQFNDHSDNAEFCGSIDTWLELCWFPLDPLLNIYLFHIQPPSPTNHSQNSLSGPGISQKESLFGNLKNKT